MTTNPSTQLALWRYQIIAPLLSITGPRGTLKRSIQEIVRRPHEHPARGSIQLGFGTVEEWLYRYRRDGLDGLCSRPRRDRGRGP